MNYAFLISSQVAELGTPRTT